MFKYKGKRKVIESKSYWKFVQWSGWSQMTSSWTTLLAVLNFPLFFIDLIGIAHQIEKCCYQHKKNLQILKGIRERGNSRGRNMRGIDWWGGVTRGTGVMRARERWWALRGTLSATIDVESCELAHTFCVPFAAAVAVAVVVVRWHLLINEVGLRTHFLVLYVFAWCYL